MSLSFAEPCRSEADRTAWVQGQDQGVARANLAWRLPTPCRPGPSRHAAVTHLVQSVP